MNVVLAVLKDLYVFAFVYRFGFSVVSKEATTIATTPKPTKVANSVTPTMTALPQPVSPPLLTAHQPQATPIETPLQKLPQGPLATAYVRRSDTALYVLPTKTFDGVIEHLGYASRVSIINKQGQWQQVSVGASKGWLPADDLTDSLATLQPKLVPGDYYGPESKTTEIVRLAIADEFEADGLLLPLQNVEYVAFRLKEKNRSVRWSQERPRLVGTWQRLLKGQQGIHMSVSPKTEAVMEYVTEEGFGHVAFVHSVYPDAAITISQVGYPEEGWYNERTLSKVEWKELRPIFIEVA